MARKKVNKSKDRKVFARTVGKVDKRTIKPTASRGGYHL